MTTAILRALRATGSQKAGNAISVLLAWSGRGLAMLGLSVLLLVGTLAAHTDLRRDLEQLAVSWLAERQSAAFVGDDSNPVETVERIGAINPRALPEPQARVSHWLSRKYRVAPEPVAALVAEAWSLGDRLKLDPHLILAVAAIESGFNPFAQSPVGAQGLMQVMTRIHADKYLGFGGVHAAFDPISNLRVGVAILQNTIARAGSTEGGLRLYVGAAPGEDDGGYAAKVLAERQRIAQVSQTLELATRKGTPGLS